MNSLDSVDTFARRHIGPSENEQKAMLKAIDSPSLSSLLSSIIPRKITIDEGLDLPAALSEEDALQTLKTTFAKNKIYKSWIGTGFHNTYTPAVIQRNILENPNWYTPYTPYQPEIAQGRLEALFNYQTMIADLTGLEIANASLLDEASAAAEALTLAYHAQGDSAGRAFFISDLCHPQNIEVARGRAKALGIPVVVGDHKSLDFKNPPFGILLQYPATNGQVLDYTDFIASAHKSGALVALATDLLALTMLKRPSDMGADIAFGNSQRFGVPLGFGGPHAAFFATRTEHARRLPGRIIGISKDATGKTAFRLALQTREQHIRREKATSNICTAQALLATMAGMYAVYHGPKGLKKIAERAHYLAVLLAKLLAGAKVQAVDGLYFDTVLLTGDEASVQAGFDRALQKKHNLRRYSPSQMTVSFDETTTVDDVYELAEAIAGKTLEPAIPSAKDLQIPGSLLRQADFLMHPVFNRYHSETEMMRYLNRLERRDLALTNAMIPLGSCTMKLNSAASLMPLSWGEVGRMHPFVPADQALGYRQMLSELEAYLAELTGFEAVSLQPNSGAQGEYAGLLAIKAFHESRGQAHRNLCLIPSSAHGTNPASATLVNYQVLVVACDSRGNIDLSDLRTKAEANRDRLAAMMVTYPSTHGVFEEGIRELCEIVHTNGGQIYLDGANLNAQLGFCKPGRYGADVCHLNLHKTFSIPHGGGGPGAGPIAVAKHLIPFLPGHTVAGLGGKQAVSAIAAAPWGSASILTIPWMYIRMMGPLGLKHATEVAVLNANYIAHQLADHYPIVYRGARNRVAHECLIDLREIKKDCGIDAEDVAKRLMDYGFHAPTISFPIPNTMMIEPTESESKAEIDRFCEAMISIREEIRDVQNKKTDATNNVLKNAPHTIDILLSSEWTRPYSREAAVYPAGVSRENKFWPYSSRIDSAFGDRNFCCSYSY